MAKFIDLGTGLPALLNKVKAWVNSKLSAKQDTLTFDNAPTAGSNNPVKSGGIKTAIDNVMPTINENGKWVIGGVTTDKDAQGPRGNTTLVNENAQGIQALIVNNVSDGGETDILSAEMGKVISQNIMLIFNALGTYAFPNGKPILSWGSTVIKYSINVNYVTGSLTITDVEVDGSSVGSLPARIVDGESLSLKLTAPSGKSVKDDSVVVTMGGVDITNDVYTTSTDTIDIPAVTGDIVIVATSVNYDAEIEYIQSSGTQWIDTGVVWAGGYRYELKAEFLQNGGNFDSILGARQTQGGNKFSVPLALQQDNRPYLQVAEGQAIVSNTTLGLYTFKGSQSGTALSLEVNGTTASGNVAGSATAATISLYMFARHRDDNANNSAAVAKLYYCKIWNGNTLVRDFIPVRVGQVGQLYDKVSGDFFANIGTGSFTLGNDK